MNATSRQFVLEDRAADAVLVSHFSPKPSATEAISPFRSLARIGRVRHTSTRRYELWERLSREANFNLECMAKKCGISVRQLERCCRRDLDLQPKKWLNEQRLIAASYLLLEEDSVKCVALKLGYFDVPHFTRAFRRVYGVNPSQYVADFWSRNAQACA